MKKQPKYSPEVIERAVRMVSEAASEYRSQWAAIEAIAAKIGCTPETLRRWVRQQERDTGQRPGPTPLKKSTSRCWSEKCASCARQMRSCVWRVRFSLRRRSAATSSREGIYRPVPPCLRFRADQQGVPARSNDGNGGRKESLR